MQSIAKIVELTGGWGLLRRRPLEIEVAGFLPLHIEVVGHGPGGGLLVSVSHANVQQVIAEVTPGNADWLPVSYRQDSLGILHEAVVSEGGVFRFNRWLIPHLKRFLAGWDRDLREQGFIEAARAAASQDQRPPGSGG